MVPTRSKAPIIASTEAAGTADKPASPHSEIKWVWIRPLVLKPQMKKVPNMIQNTRLPETLRSTWNGVAKVMCMGAAATMGCVGSAPNGRRPMSLGRLRMNSSTSTATSVQPMKMGSTAMRQPKWPISQALTGRKISWPVAELAVSRPTTRPRWVSNQRLETTALSTSAVMPEPTPSITPHSTTSCQNCVIRVASARPPATSDSAVTTTLRSPKRSIRMAENGPIRPNSTKRTASADEICSVSQPNSLLKGCIMAPGRPSAADEVSAVRKVMATMTQEKWMPRRSSQPENDCANMNASFYVTAPPPAAARSPLRNGMEFMINDDHHKYKRYFYGGIQRDTGKTIRLPRPCARYTPPLELHRSADADASRSSIGLR